ncbi:thiamine phosphate synthase [Formosa sediminum]|uniref:Thiamine-phosphate synthase n=1 Tax=Formosa sediminum TaxID=2594004 RepID=A0A516GTL7_9FLAO|nr:thiamine phosphate synthase [Formosa sediminum]QDO94858.1 thiamine phosphate synthase [Formosa sediminum]
MISKLHYITQGETPEQHLEYIQNACSSGADWIQLRMKHFDEQVVLETAKKARALTMHFQTRLIINDYYKIAKTVNADGVHLGKNDACPLEAREYLGKWYRIGGTANTLDDCRELIEKQVDYIGLGPFRFTTTKSNLGPLLGISGYQHIIKQLDTNIPIIAIGGITLKDIPELLETGIYGVAISGEITKNFNTISAFNTTLQGPNTQEHVYKMPKKEDNED